MITDTASMMNSKQVMAFYGIGKATLYRWINSGKIPKPRKILGRGKSNFWSRNELPTE